MPSKVVVGAQWGDEGKETIMDILASRADVVVRAQGGSNAGHIVERAGRAYRLRLLPAGILYPDVLCLIGCGVVLEPALLLEELDGLKAHGLPCDQLRIDPRAHIVMPWHILMDQLSERSLGGARIGTTGRGVGPCYMEKAERTSLRVCDLIRPDVLEKKVRAAGEAKNQIITRMYRRPPMEIDAIIEEYAEYGRRLAGCVADVSVLTFDALGQGKNVLFEGAQGTLLDLDMGTYPYVTSSNPVAGGICTGVGIGPGSLGDVLGVARAYTTRMGEGPFPTELHGEAGQHLRARDEAAGGPRRIGWFDAVMLRHAVRVNGMTGLAVNALDALSGIGPLKICTAYRREDGTLLRDFPPSLEELEECKPVYETLGGFEGKLDTCQTFEELPEGCRDYIHAIEEAGGCRALMVGAGGKTIER